MFQVLLCFVFLCSEIAVEFAVPKYLPAFAVFSRRLGQSKREAADTVAAYQAAMVASRRVWMEVGTSIEIDRKLRETTLEINKVVSVFQNCFDSHRGNLVSD